MKCPGGDPALLMQDAGSFIFSRLFRFARILPAPRGPPGVLPNEEDAMSRVESPENVVRSTDLHRVVDEARRLPGEMLESYFDDSDLAVVSSAALALCVLGEPTAGDPLAAPRRVIAKALAIEGDPERQGAILQGALLTGDRRIVELVTEARRGIGEPALDVLASARSGFLFDAVVEFFLVWLEERPSAGPFESVAMGLAEMRRTVCTLEVADVRRKLPAWGPEPGPAVEVLASWPLEEYAERIAPRLVALHRRCPRSRKLPYLLYAWGVDPGDIAPQRAAFKIGARRSRPARAQRAGASDRRSVLLFYPRRIESNGCFAYESDVKRVDAMHEAIRLSSGWYLPSKTWGEFRRRLPRGEFEALPLWIENEGTFVYRSGGRYQFTGGDDVRRLIEESDGQCVIRSSDKFDPELIPGFSDGDWPPFLEPDQDGILPRDFCVTYGTRKYSFVSGSWWEFPLERAREMKADLEARGYRVKIERPGPAGGEQ